MKELKRNLLSTTVISAVVVVGLGVGGAALVATGSALAACGAKAACNPCAAKKKQCNPCAAKKGCNPCATKKKKGASLHSFQGREIQVAACSPCATKKKCNPCAAKKGCNPCATKKKKGASFDSFQGREIQVAACSPCATKKKCNPCAAKKGCNPCAAKKGCNPCATKKKGSIRESYASLLRRRRDRPGHWRRGRGRRGGTSSGSCPDSGWRCRGGDAGSPSTGCGGCSPSAHADRPEPVPPSCG